MAKHNKEEDQSVSDAEKYELIKQNLLREVGEEGLNQSVAALINKIIAEVIILDAVNPVVSIEKGEVDLSLSDDFLYHSEVLRPYLVALQAIIDDVKSKEVAGHD